MPKVPPFAGLIFVLCLLAASVSSPQADGQLDQSVYGSRAKAVQRGFASASFVGNSGTGVATTTMATSAATPGRTVDVATSHATTFMSQQPERSAEDMIQFCTAYEELYLAIHADLALWQESGITQELMARTVEEFTTGGHHALVLGFHGGKAYLIDEPQLEGAGHHANIMFTYMLAMLHLEQQFGSSIPDVEFVLATSDRPMVLLPSVKAHPSGAATVAPVVPFGVGPSQRAGSDTVTASTVSAGDNSSIFAGVAVNDQANDIAAALSDINAVTGNRLAADSAGAVVAQPRQQLLHKGLNGAGSWGTIADISPFAVMKLSEPGELSEPHVSTRGRHVRQEGAAAGLLLGGGVGDSPAAATSGELALTTEPTVAVAGLGAVAGTAGVTDVEEAAAPVHWPPALVLRFCSSLNHADVAIPIFHFYTKKYTRNLLNTIPERDKQYPWEGKKPILFGRFSKYSRYLHPAANTTLRAGVAGKDICQLQSSSTLVCRVRQHLIEWAAPQSALMDIRSAPMLSMQKHAQFKYLLHVDGQALSSRFEQLLPMNSLIFKEDSGYYTFFHHLLQPHVHYVPFWKRGPEELLDALNWAKEHDDEARRMAKEAQVFAIKYLNKYVLACYWYRLFREMGRLMRYRAGPEHKTYPYRMPVRKYLDDVARHFKGGRYYFSRIEW